jgi:hypothetical protein
MSLFLLLQEVLRSDKGKVVPVYAMKSRGIVKVGLRLHSFLNLERTIALLQSNQPLLIIEEKAPGAAEAVWTLRRRENVLPLTGIELDSSAV